MRHKCRNRKLSKPTDQRLALLTGLVTELFRYGKIKTSHVRAKEAAKIAEKVITLAKEGSLSSVRQISHILRAKTVLKEVLVAGREKYSERPGGYTRVVKIGLRRGDNAPISLLELV